MPYINDAQRVLRHPPTLHILLRPTTNVDREARKLRRFSPSLIRGQQSGGIDLSRVLFSFTLVGACLSRRRHKLKSIPRALRNRPNRATSFQEHSTESSDTRQ